MDICERTILYIYKYNNKLWNRFSWLVLCPECIPSLKPAHYLLDGQTHFPRKTLFNLSHSIQLSQCALCTRCGHFPQPIICVIYNQILNNGIANLWPIEFNWISCEILSGRTLVGFCFVLLVLFKYNLSSRLTLLNMSLVAFYRFICAYCYRVVCLYVSMHAIFCRGNQKIGIIIVKITIHWPWF